MRYPELLPYEHEHQTLYDKRLLLRRNVESQHERCAGRTFLCWDCIDGFGEFMEQANAAKARDEEWEVE